MRANVSSGIGRSRCACQRLKRDKEVCTFICMCLVYCIYIACAYECIFVCVFMFVYKCVCVCACVCVCVCVCVCAHEPARHPASTQHQIQPPPSRRVRRLQMTCKAQSQRGQRQKTCTLVLSVSLHELIQLSIREREREKRERKEKRREKRREKRKRGFFVRVRI